MMKQIKNIVIVGAGNIGTYFACVCANEGYDTSIYCSKPELINNVLNVVGEETIVANNIKASNNMEIFVDADMVFVTYPAFMFKGFSRKIEPYIKQGTYIGVMPGTGAVEFAFKNLIDKGAILFGIQRVPAIARLKEYGETVCIEGKKKELYLASIPLKYCDDLSCYCSHPIKDDK